MDTKNLGIHRMVLNFSFLPLQAPERSIVCKLHLKYAPLLQLGIHLRLSEEKKKTFGRTSPIPTPFPSPFRASRGGWEEQPLRRKLEMIQPPQYS